MSKAQGRLAKAGVALNQAVQTITARTTYIRHSCNINPSVTSCYAEKHADILAPGRWPVGLNVYVEQGALRCIRTIGP